MVRRLALGALGMLAVGAPPGAAKAATVAPLKPCYVSAGSADSAREKVGLLAQGFTPNAAATVALDGAVVMANAQIDASGTVSGSVTAPYQAGGQRPFTLSVAENDNPTNAAGGRALVSALEVRVTPMNARPSSRVRFRGRGFTGGPAVYGHYLRRGHVRKTVRLATAGGPCGTFDVRRTQLPIRRPASGQWTLQIDQEAVWQANPRSVRVTLVIDVTRAPAAGPSRIAVPSAGLRVVRAAPSPAVPRGGAR
jgi:hypothetical protein